MWRKLFSRTTQTLSERSSQWKAVHSKSLVCWTSARTPSSERATKITPFSSLSKPAASFPPISDDMMLQIRAKSGMLDKALNQVEGVLRHRRGLKYSQQNDFDLQTATRIIQEF